MRGGRIWWNCWLRTDGPVRLHFPKCEECGRVHGEPMVRLKPGVDFRAREHRPQVPEYLGVIE